MTTKQQAEGLHKKANTFILSCVGEDGYPLTKAVVAGKHRESLDVLYFATNTSSNFVAEVRQNPKTGVYFYSRKLLNWKGCQLKGDMEIVSDMAVKERYWRPMFKSAYPSKSFADPDFCVLRFVPTSGRYYANFKIADFEL